MEDKLQVYSLDRIGLINDYKRHFECGTNAFIDNNQILFSYHRKNVIKTRVEIENQFGIKAEDVAKFAFEYEEKAKLYAGLFSSTNTDHLYFIKGLNSIKIGRTWDPKTRLSALQVSSPYKLSYIHIFHCRGHYEKDVHELFDYLRISGEWFKDHKDIYDYISMLKQKNRNRDRKRVLMNLKVNAI